MARYGRTPLRTGTWLAFIHHARTTAAYDGPRRHQPSATRSRELTEPGCTGGLLGPASRPRCVLPDNTGQHPGPLDAGGAVRRPLSYLPRPGGCTDDSTTSCKRTPVSRPQVPAAEPGIRTPALRGRHHRTDRPIRCAPRTGAGQSDGRSYRRLRCAFGCRTSRSVALRRIGLPPARAGTVAR